MFVCPKCHEERKYQGFHIGLSFGTCEVCGAVVECYDCQCYRFPPKLEEAEGGSQ